MTSLTMTLRICLATALMLMTAKAEAAEIELSVPEADSAETITVTYDCGGREFSVDYMNAGPVSLAVFTIDGTTVVASNVLSASGARYAGSHYIWWNKGREADLYDLMKGEDAPPVHCTETS